MTTSQSQGQSPAKRKPAGRGVQLVLWPTSLFFAGLFALFVAERMVTTEGMAVGWVAIDYLVKVIVVIGSLLLSKYVPVFDPVAVAVALVLAILATSAIQVTAVRMKQQVESELG